MLKAQLFGGKVDVEAMVETGNRKCVFTLLLSRSRPQREERSRFRAEVGGQAWLPTVTASKYFKVTFGTLF